MNRAHWTWVLEKAWKIDSGRKSLVGNDTEFENDATLNRDPMKRFQKWDRMGKLRRLCNDLS